MANLLLTNLPTSASFPFVYEHISGKNIVSANASAPGGIVIDKECRQFRSMLPSYIPQNNQLQFEFHARSFKKINNFFLVFEVPEQTFGLKPTDTAIGVSYVDLFGAKMIKQIDFLVDNALVETFTTASVVWRLLEKYKRNLGVMIPHWGGTSNIMEKNRLVKRTIILPIPFLFFPIFPQDFDIDFTFLFRITFHPSLTSVLRYTPQTNLGSLHPIDYSTCYFVIEEETNFLHSEQILGDAALNAYFLREIYERKLQTTRKIQDRLTYLSFPTNCFLDTAVFALTNPLFAQNNLFYGARSFNAICNFFSSLVCPLRLIQAKAAFGILFLNLNTAELCRYNLETNNMVYAALDTSVRAAKNNNTITLTVSSSLRLVLKTNSAWPEQLFFNVDTFATAARTSYNLALIEQIDYFFDAALFYTINTATQDASEALFQVDSSPDVVFLGCRDFSLFENTSLEEKLLLKLQFSQPIAESLTLVDERISKRFVFINDPATPFLDLDASIKIGAINFTYESMNGTYKTDQQSLLDFKLENFFSRFESLTTADNPALQQNLYYTYAPQNILKFGKQTLNLTDRNVQVKFDLALFEAEKGHLIESELCAGFFKTKMKNIDFSLEILFFCKRFLVFAQALSYLEKDNEQLNNIVQQTFRQAQ